ncbi:MAG: F0F1 ATP synthase subunit epsilon [Acidobacteriota bacterium]|nr:F0F1 ATP synthase subunit epsilon [Acidobacteriota bacterium]
MADITLPTEIHLDIVTPDRLVAHDAVTAVTIPGKNGALGILPGHAPLLTELASGAMEYTSGTAKHTLCVNWGFAEVLGDRVIVLAQSAERAEEIDVERAEKAKLRAEDRLKRFDDLQVDRERARIALIRAMARLETAHKLRG